MPSLASLFVCAIVLVTVSYLLMTNKRALHDVLFGFGVYRSAKGQACMTVSFLETCLTSSDKDARCCINKSGIDVIALVGVLAGLVGGSILLAFLLVVIFAVIFLCNDPGKLYSS